MNDQQLINAAVEFWESAYLFTGITPLHRNYLLKRGGKPCGACAVGAAGVYVGVDTSYRHSNMAYSKRSAIAIARHLHKTLGTYGYAWWRRFVEGVECGFESWGFAGDENTRPFRLGRIAGERIAGLVFIKCPKEQVKEVPCLVKSN
jgi:hypothetical protein